ncbi:M14 family zinc carboxypeptidase [Chloroflexota bacterium]
MNRKRAITFLALAILALSFSKFDNAAGEARSVQKPFSPLDWLPAGQIPALPNANLQVDETYWVVRAYFKDRQMVYDLASWAEPWEVQYKAGYLVLGVDKQGYERLINAGFEVRIDSTLTTLFNTPRQYLPNQVDGIPGYPCYRTVEETFASAQAMVSDHPDLAAWVDVGDSWDKGYPGGEPGYDLMVLILTNQNLVGTKPKLLITTAVHAREYATAELATRFAEYLTANYGSDADATWLLDHNEIHLLLMANPDGRKQAETGISWRKNTNQNYCSPTSDMRGADLNRNFEFEWGCCSGSSGLECDELYRGPSPASEPETQTMQNYMRQIFPDQRGPNLSDPAPEDASGLYLDIHSYSELVIWPWGFTAQTPPNSAALQTLGRKFAYFNDYHPEQAIGLYPTDGTTDDFAYGDLGVASYTFELGTAFFQNCTTFENTILPDNLAALVYAAKTARAPYQLPSGPDAYGLSITEAIVLSGNSAELSATIDDTRFNIQNGSEPTQNIQAAEYYIDIPPWVTTTLPIPYAMNAADGSFDQTTEIVTATIDTADLQGKHIIFVRGQDAGGNWGTVSAKFIYVIDPEVDPTIQGYVRQAISLTPLEATLSAGLFTTTSDPLTGFYSLQVISDTYNLKATAIDHAPETASALSAQNYATLQQDFSLMPVCQVYSYDVEAGAQGWEGDLLWAISEEEANSPTHAWSDSPGINYNNMIDTSLVSPLLDLSDYNNLSLNFWHTYTLEANYDYGYIEYSLDGGSSWIILESYNGYQSTWIKETVDISALDGQSNILLRFRLNSDLYVTYDGWHIDDISISGSGIECSSLSENQIYFPLVIKG